MSAAHATVPKGIVGILGGMGPLATLDFMQKVLAHTPARTDQEHIPLVVASIPQIPDRTAALRGQGPSPLQALIHSGERLVHAGAQLIVMPCNTAHMWYAELEQTLRIPMLHIVDAALTNIVTAHGARAHVGMLATPGTLDSGLYPQRAAQTPNARRLRWIPPTPTEINDWIAPGIAAVKAGNIRLATHNLAHAATALQQRGASCILLGCTEIPIALRPQQAALPLVDATDALARATVEWYYGRSVEGG